MMMSKALRWVQEMIEPVAGDDAPADARTLVCAAAQIQSAQLLLHTRTKLQARQVGLLHDMIQRRLDHEPTQYIVGTVNFLGHALRCDPRALIPRFETEFLAMEAMERSKAHKLRDALDMCTGSGCLAVALSLRGLLVTACDHSEDALMLARENAQRLHARVMFYQGDLFGALPKGSKFDLIVANPPYVSSADIRELQLEVRGHEPHLALDGGEDGLAFYRRIAQDSGAFLREKGWLMLEVGAGQHEAVAVLLHETYENVEILTDLRGEKRVVQATQRKESPC